MACTIEDITDQFDPKDFDKALGDLLLGHEGNVQHFLVSVFDFLRRKSNFFRQSDAKRRVLESYKQITGETDGFKAGFFGSTKPAVVKAADKPAEKATVASTTGASVATTAPTAAPPSRSGPEQPAAVSPSSSTAEAADADKSTVVQGGAAENIEGEAVAAAAPAIVPGAAEQQPEASASQDADKCDQSKGLKPNAGRGADLATYSWTQTLSEVSVNIPVGKGIKGKQLDVVIGKQHLTVGVKGQTPLLDGALSEPIKPDEAMWNLADGVVELTLTKAEGMHWWNAVMAGGPTIDVQAVEPENSKLTDLDPETRQTVEKMMFDQRQKALGLPTSEEMQKQEMLKRFMAAHPEMDFSNAKIM